MKKAKKLVSVVKEVDKDNSRKIAFSSIINREDEDFKDNINDVSNKLKKASAIQQVWILLAIQILMDRGKLHLNRKGTAALAKIFCRFVRS